MTKSKKIFAALAVVFFILLFYASYDISTRTTFPGSKPQLEERIRKEYLQNDTVKVDSVRPTGKGSLSSTILTFYP
jgi:hypothetical protein